MNEFGTPQPLLLDLWRKGLHYMRKRPVERALLVSHGLAPFVAGLSAESAEEVLTYFNTPDAVRAFLFPCLHAVTVLLTLCSTQVT